MVADVWAWRAESKSLFASFSSEKEESFRSFLKKRTKKLLILGGVAGGGLVYCDLPIYGAVCKFGDWIMRAAAPIGWFSQMRKPIEDVVSSDAFFNLRNR